jgi:hypothetical protein
MHNIKKTIVCLTLTILALTLDSISPGFASLDIIEDSKKGRKCFLENTKDEPKHLKCISGGVSDNRDINDFSIKFVSGQSCFETIEEEIKHNPTKILEILIQNRVDTHTTEELLFRYAPGVHEKLSDERFITTDRYRDTWMVRFFRFGSGIAFDLVAIECFKKTSFAGNLKKWMTDTLFNQAETLGIFVKDSLGTVIKDEVEPSIGGGAGRMVSYLLTSASNFLVSKLEVLTKSALLNKVPIVAMVQGVCSNLALTGTKIIKSIGKKIENKLRRNRVPHLDKARKESRFEILWDQLIKAPNVTLETVESQLKKKVKRAHWILDEEGLIKTNPSSIFWKSYLWKGTKLACWFTLDFSISFIAAPVASAMLKPILTDWILGKLIKKGVIEEIENYYYHWALTGERVPHFIKSFWMDIKDGARYLKNFFKLEALTETPLLGTLVHSVKKGFHSLDQWFQPFPLDTVDQLNQHLKVVQETIQIYGEQINIQHNIKVNPDTLLLRNFKNYGARMLSWASSLMSSTTQQSEEQAKEMSKKILQDTASTLKKKVGLYYMTHDTLKKICGGVASFSYDLFSYCFLSVFSKFTNSRDTFLEQILKIKRAFN